MPDRRPPPAFRRTGDAVLLVAGAGMAFATSGPLARYAEPAHPLAIVFGRVALAALVLFAIEGRALARSIASMRWRQRAGVTLAGLILAAHFALFVWGLKTTSLPAAVTLISLEPLSVVLWALFIHGARPSRREQIGLLCATVGACVIGRGAGSGEHRLTGDLLVVGAVILYGAYLSVARSLREAVPPRPYAALVYAACAVFSGGALLAVNALHASQASPPFMIPLHSTLAIIGLALVPTLIGHTAVQAAARHAPPALVALVSPGETIGGLVIGALWLGAIPTAVETIGALVILAGVVCAISGTRAPAEPE